MAREAALAGVGHRLRGLLRRTDDAGGHLLRLRPTPWALAVSCLGALVLRLWVAYNSVGSDDALTWASFAESVTKVGVTQTYEQLPLFNHPPLMGLLAAWALKLATRLHLEFAFVFKLPSILASTGLMYVVIRRLNLAWPWLLVLAVNPLDVLISSYHGNTDLMCTALSVLATMAAQAERPTWAGLALGAAINVKLIPVVLIGPLLVCLRGHRSRLHMLLGLAVWTFPFGVVLLSAREAFVRNAIRYNSYRAQWGLGLISEGLGPSFPSIATQLWDCVEHHAKAALLATTSGYALLCRAARTVDPFKVGAFTFMSFLVLAPGFGVQYLIYVSPFLVMTSPRRAAAYLLLAGTFGFSLYYWYWTRSFPPTSLFSHYPDPNSVLVGFATWLALCTWWLADLRDAAVGLWHRLVPQQPSRA
jgi:hypothetical protein